MEIGGGHALAHSYTPASRHHVLYGVIALTIYGIINWTSLGRTRLLQLSEHAVEREMRFIL